MALVRQLQEAIQDSVQAPPPDTSALIESMSAIKRTLLNGEQWLSLLGSGGRILLILTMAWLLIKVIDKANRKWITRFDSLPDIHPRRQRSYTVSTLLGSLARYTLWPLAIIMVLSELNLDITALLATAGIAGIALGFGAQTLVQDFISGIFLLFDDTIHVGDFVSIGAHEGTVEYIGVRLIKVRKFNGELLMVPAGELRTFGNRSIDYMRVIVNVGLAYEQNIEDILPIMQKVANTWAEEHRDILEEEQPLVQAITDLAESSVNARIVVQVTPGEQFAAERELRRRLKNTFDEKGIEIPFPRRTVYTKQG